MADSAFLKQSYEAYAQAENEFQQAMDESLHPHGPDMLYDLVAGLGLPAGAAVLDVGCGEGGHAIDLARRFGLRVHGLDPVPRHVEVARQHLADAASHRQGLGELVSFGPGRAEDLPAADGTADLVWCRDVLVHVDQLGTAYREFRRVLRPGGRALVYQMFSTARLEPAEAAWLLPVLGCAAPNMRPEYTEAAIRAAGLRIDRCVILGSQWGEYAQERSGAGGRHLLHAARLLRDPGRYIQRFGQANYDIALADCLWHVYRMIGKLSPRVYLLSPPAERQVQLGRAEQNNRPMMSPETDARPPGGSASAAAHLAEGLALREKRRMKAAVVCFERAVAADPALTEGWFWLAVTRDNRGQETEAVPAYQQALRLGIDDRNQRAQAWTWLASSLSKTGRHSEAVDALTEAVRLGGYEPKGEFGRLRVAIGRRAMRAQQLAGKDRSELHNDDRGAAG